MPVQECFNKYRSKLVAEGILKAICCGLAVGFAVNALVALITWCISGVNGLWLSIGLGLGAWAVSVPLLYIFLFKPTEKRIAERVDKLGMEERAITMLELQNDGSVMANFQREDTRVALNSASSSKIKISLFGKLSVVAKVVAISVMAVLVACGVSFTTLTGLADIGAIGSGSGGIGGQPEGVAELKFGSVRYVADRGGLLIGEEADQLVLVEKDEVEYFAVTITAYPEFGYRFMRWSDQEPVYETVIVDGWLPVKVEVPQSPTRTDSFKITGNGKGEIPEGYDDLTEEKVICAIFEEYDDSQPHTQNGSGNNSGNNSMSPDDGPPSGSNGNGGNNSENGYDGSDASANEAANQFEDGDTYYRTKYEQYLEEARRYLEEGKEIPPELKALIELYANAIA